MKPARRLLNQLLQALRLNEPTPGDDRPPQAFAKQLFHNYEIIEQLAYDEDMPVDQMAIEITSAGIAQRKAYRRSVNQWHSLTPKEREVTAYLCLGYSNDEIARELHIAIGTVKAHVHHILKKFRVENRTQVAQKLWWWDAAGWLMADSE